MKCSPVTITVLAAQLVAAASARGAEATEAFYLREIVAALEAKAPANRTINIVCHGHSVPAGYFKTPAVDSLHAYPNLLRVGLAKRFPNAVINVIVTAINGEDAIGGARRFEAEVLSHKPDVLLMDYALNDRGAGLEKARAAWSEMIGKATARGIKVVLLTPTGDLSMKSEDPNDSLNRHAAQIRALAKEHGVALADSLQRFKDYLRAGGAIADLMSQVNHPNAKGHQLVAGELLSLFHR